MLADFFSDSSIDGWDVVLAVIVAVAGWIAASLAKRAVLRLLRKVPSIGAEASGIIARLTRYTLLLLTLGIVLTVLGAPLQPVLAIAILIAAVGILALRGIAANFGAGLVIQARHVVHIGDEIKVMEFVGTVKELNGRSVIIHCADGRSVRIPNSMLLDSPLVNLTERNLYRSEIEVRTRGESSTHAVDEIIAAALDRAERVRSVPHPQTLLAAHSPQAKTFRVRFWHDPHHRGEIRSEAVGQIAAALAAEGIAASIDWKVPPPPFTPPPEF